MEIIKLHAPDLGDKRPEILKLIEKEFPYPKDQSFYEDFLPLMHPSAQTLHYIGLEANKIVAHIGLQKRNIVVGISKLPISMLGGVCVAKEFQGKGVGSRLIDEVLDTHNQQVAFFLLWSNLHDFYQKKGFELAIGQREYTQTEENLAIPHLSLKPLNETTPEHQKIIKSLYAQNLKNFSLPERTENIWKILFSMKTPLLGSHEEDPEKGYFILGKGADLPGVIHELFGEPEWINQFTEATLWTPEVHPLLKSSKFLLNPLGLIKVGNSELFNQFKKAYGGEGNVKDILGPGIKHSPSLPLFIPGLDSI